MKYSGASNEADELENVAKIKAGELANFDDVKAGQRHFGGLFPPQRLHAGEDGSGANRE